MLTDADDTGSLPTTCALAPSPESMDFGVTTLGETTWKTLQLWHVCDTSVHITQLVSSNAFIFQVEPDFTIPTSLSPGEGLTIQIGFSPYEDFEYAATHDVEADADGGGILVPLGGTGESIETCTISPA